MTSPDHRPGATPEPNPAPPYNPDDEATGLPGLKTWKAVYVVVLASFVLWVGLLYTLGVIFR